MISAHTLAVLRGTIDALDPADLVKVALLAEIDRLTAALARANEQAERFERGWYLRGDALEWIAEHSAVVEDSELRDRARQALEG